MEPVDERWDRCLQRLPAHSFFVGPTWARILEDGGLGLRCAAVLGSDGSRELLLPLARKRGRFGTRNIRSMPFGTYGGPLVVGEPDDDAVGPLVAHLRAKLGVGWFVATPGPWPHLALGRSVATYATHVLDLRAGLDALWKGLDKDARNQVRQAERAGVEVTIDNTQTGFDDFFSMLQASATRWGRKDPGKPRTLFESIRRHATDEEVGLWLARVAGRAAAGALCFYGKSEVFYWSGAMHMEHARSRANNLIQWRIIQHAVAHDFATYNMGASGELHGVRRFKEGFGSQPRDYPAYFIGTGPFSVAPAVLRLRDLVRR